MKKLSKEAMKKVMGGVRVTNFSPCSTGKCGPDKRYNCSVEYEEKEENAEPTCCCGHSDYNDDCMGA